MAVPSLDNRPRYRTPEVQVSVPQLPTLEPTPAVKTENRQVSVERKLVAEVSVSDRLVRVPDAIMREALAWVHLRKPVASVHEEEEEEESARGEISDEDHEFCGPWVSKGNPTGFLYSDDEELLNKAGRSWMRNRMSKLTVDEWEEVARFLLIHTVDLVSSELVESDPEMQQFDLVVRILGEDGSVDGEGREAMSKTFHNLGRERDKVHQQQDDMEDMLEAQDGIITGL